MMIVGNAGIESDMLCPAPSILSALSCGQSKLRCILTGVAEVHQSGKGPESLESKADLRLAASKPLFPHNAWSVSLRKNLHMRVTPLPSAHKHTLLRPDMAPAAMTLTGGGHGLDVLLVTPRHVSSDKAWHGAENSLTLRVPALPTGISSPDGFHIIWV